MKYFRPAEVGFTLLESILTLAISGIFAAYAGGRMYLSTPDAATQERVLTVARVSHARDQGIQRGGACLVLQANAIAYGTADAPMQPLPGETASQNLSEGVTLAPSGTLCFDAHGRLCAGASFKNAATDSAGGRYCAKTEGRLLTFRDGNGTATLEINGNGHVVTQ